MTAQKHPADIIAESIRLFQRTEGAGRVAEIGLSALTAAGYRLIGPGELDRETIERCAKVADGAESENWTRRSAAAKSKPDDCAYYLWAEHQAKAIAIALRALQSQEAENGH